MLINYFRNLGRSTVFFDGSFLPARPWARRIRGPVPQAFLRRPLALARRPVWWTIVAARKGQDEGLQHVHVAALQEVGPAMEARCLSATV
jgi:hypothetical protein